MTSSSDQDAFDESLQAIVSETASWHRDTLYRRVEFLKKNGGSSYLGLLEVINNKDKPKEVRKLACWLVGRLGMATAVPALRRCLDDESIEVRSAAIESLGELESDFSKISDMLTHDPSAVVRESAAYALGHFRNPQSAYALRRVLKNSAEEPRVRGMAAEQLGYLRYRGSVPTLVASLQDPSPEVRFWSVFALGVIGDKRALPELTSLASKDHAELQNLGSISEESRDAIRRIEEASADGSRE